VGAAGQEAEDARSELAEGRPDTLFGGVLEGRSPSRGLAGFLCGPCKSRLAWPSDIGIQDPSLWMLPRDRINLICTQ